jgi:uncharacterized protein YdaU (DUF1376 family)
MRHFQHHIGDYAAATAHLSVLEDGIYHRLLRRYYETERPLPADIAEVARLIRLKHRHELRLLPRVLKEFFSLSQDGWRQSRADKEINKINGWRKNLGAHRADSSGQSPITHHPLSRIMNHKKAPSGLSHDHDHDHDHEHESCQVSPPIAARESLEGSTHDGRPMIPMLTKRMPT